MSELQLKVATADSEKTALTKSLSEANTKAKNFETQGAGLNTLAANFQQKNSTLNDTILKLTKLVKKLKKTVKRLKNKR